MLFVTLFLVAFVVIGGVVMFLSKTIDHGEARFDGSGKVIKDKRTDTGPARPAQRIEDINTREDPKGQVKDDE